MTDWQERLTVERTAHEEVEQQMATMDGEYQNLTESYHQARAALVLRKERIEGHMEVYAALIDGEHASHRVAGQEYVDVLQGIVDAAPTSTAALASLNGVEQRLKERDAPTDA